LFGSITEHGARDGSTPFVIGRNTPRLVARLRRDSATGGRYLPSADCRSRPEAALRERQLFGRVL